MKPLVFLLTLMLYPSPKQLGCLEMDVVVLCDVSGSVGGFEHHIQDALTSFRNRLDISEQGIRMSIVTFSSDASVLCPLTGDEEAIKYATERISSDAANTNIVQGFYIALDQLIERGRSGARKMIIVLSDGAVDSRIGGENAARQIQAIGIGICTVTILTNTVDKEFMQNISNGCYVESNYENLSEQMAKMDICL